MNKLTDHFSLKEVECNCGCGYASINMKLINALEELRGLIKRPIHCTSVCRCPDHNKRVGGVKTSQHIKGNAADIYVIGITLEELLCYIKEVPAFVNGGIGVYWKRGFIHVDVRGHKARWEVL